MLIEDLLEQPYGFGWILDHIASSLAEHPGRLGRIVHEHRIGWRSLRQGDGGGQSAQQESDRVSMEEFHGLFRPIPAQDHTTLMRLLFRA